MEQLREWFDGGDLIAIVTALLAAGVSVWLFIRQERLDRANLRIQERLAYIEEARRAEEVARTTQADLRVEMRLPRPPAEDYALVVTNAGGTSALDVTLDSLISRDSGECPMLLNSPFPVASIHAGDSITSYFVIPYGSGPPFEAKVSWTDPRGRQTKTQTVTPF